MSDGISSLNNIHTHNQRASVCANLQQQCPVFWSRVCKSPCSCRSLAPGGSQGPLCRSLVKVLDRLTSYMQLTFCHCSEPPNNGHIGGSSLVHCREGIPLSEVTKCTARALKQSIGVKQFVHCIQGLSASQSVHCIHVWPSVYIHYSSYRQTHVHVGMHVCRCRRQNTPWGAIPQTQSCQTAYYITCRMLVLQDDTVTMYQTSSPLLSETVHCSEMLSLSSYHFMTPYVTIYSNSLDIYAIAWSP